MTMMWRPDNKLRSSTANPLPLLSFTSLSMHCVCIMWVSRAALFLWGDHPFFSSPPTHTLTLSYITYLLSCILFLTRPFSSPLVLPLLFTHNVTHRAHILISLSSFASPRHFGKALIIAQFLQRHYSLHLFCKGRGIIKRMNRTHHTTTC